MRGRDNRRHRLLLDIAALILGALFCLGALGFPALDFGKPAAIAGDHIFFLEMARSYIDGNGFRINPSLGFPEVRDNAYFPNFDFSQRLLLGAFAKLTASPFLVTHLAYLVGTVLAYATAYSSLRVLRARPSLAALGGIGFVVSPYFASRAFAHDMLALDYSVPLGVTLALLFGHSGAHWSRGRVCFAFIAVAIIGTSGIYYGFFAAMFLLFAATANSLATLRAPPVMLAAGATLSIAALLAVTALGSALWPSLAGQVPMPPRYAFHQLLFGLSIASAADVFAFTAELKHSVDLARLLTPAFFINEGGAGEWPNAILTLIILGSPLTACVLALALRPADPGKDYYLRLILLSALCSVFGLIVAQRGGVGFLFNLLSPIIRSQSRISPYLTFFAIVTVTAAVEIALRHPRPLVRAFAMLAGAIALLLSVPPLWQVLPAKQKRLVDTPAAQAKQRSIAAVLAAKDAADIRSVLQLPVAPWPEAQPIGAFSPYEHQLFFIYDRPGSPTRWSYGATVHQAGWGENLVLSRDYDSLPQAARAARYEALLLQKRAYSPVKQWLYDASLAEACKLVDDDLFAFYALAKEATCLAPMPRPFALAPSYKIAAESVGAELLLDGWATTPADLGWIAESRARIAVPLPDTSRPIRVGLLVAADRSYRASSATTTVTIDGVSGRIVFSPDADTARLELDLPPMRKAFVIATIDLGPEPSTVPDANPTRERGIALRELTVRPID